jgi:ABC-type histidine transport system ATPase subunit
VIGGEHLAMVPGHAGALKACEPARLQRLCSQVAMLFQHFNLWLT